MELVVFVELVELVLFDIDPKLNDVTSTQSESPDPDGVPEPQEPTTVFSILPYPVPEATVQTYQAETPLIEILPSVMDAVE